METLICITIATILAHFVGSIILFTCVGGVNGLISAPFMALFGLFFIPLEALAVWIQWISYNNRTKSKQYVIKFLTLSALITAPIMTAIGPKEDTHEIKWSIGYCLGTIAAAISSGYLIAALKPSSENQMPNQSLE